MHSYEEDPEGSEYKVYRPCDFKDFPLSRYRHKLELRENNECSWLRLVPNDAHFMVEGTWDFNENELEIVASEASGNAVLKFKIFGVNEKGLKLGDAK